MRCRFVVVDVDGTIEEIRAVAQLVMLIACWPAISMQEFIALQPNTGPGLGQAHEPTLAEAPPARREKRPGRHKEKVPTEVLYGRHEQALAQLALQGKLTTTRVQKLGVSDFYRAKELVAYAKGKLAVPSAGGKSAEQEIAALLSGDG